MFARETEVARPRVARPFAPDRDRLTRVRDVDLPVVAVGLQESAPALVRRTGRGVREADRFRPRDAAVGGSREPHVPSAGARVHPPDAEIARPTRGGRGEQAVRPLRREGCGWRPRVAAVGRRSHVDTLRGIRFGVHRVDVRQVPVGVAGERRRWTVEAVRATVRRALGLAIARGDTDGSPGQAAVVGERDVRMDLPSVALVVVGLRERDVLSVGGRPGAAREVVAVVVGHANERERGPAVVRDADLAVAMARTVHVDVHVLSIRRHGELRLVRPADRHSDGIRPREAVIGGLRVDDAGHVALKPDGIDGPGVVDLDDRVVLAVHDAGTAAEEMVGSPRGAAVGRHAQDDPGELATVTPARRGVAGGERVDVRSVRISGDRRLPIVGRGAPHMLGGPAGVGDGANRSGEPEESGAVRRVERGHPRLRDVRGLEDLARGRVLLLLAAFRLGDGTRLADGGRRAWTHDRDRDADHEQQADEHGDELAHGDLSEKERFGKAQGAVAGALQSRQPVETRQVGRSEHEPPESAERRRID